MAQEQHDENQNAPVRKRGIGLPLALTATVAGAIGLGSQLIKSSTRRNVAPEDTIAVTSKERAKEVSTWLRNYELGEAEAKLKAAQEENRKAIEALEKQQQETRDALEQEAQRARDAAQAEKSREALRARLAQMRVLEESMPPENFQAMKEKNDVEHAAAYQSLSVPMIDMLKEMDVMGRGRPLPQEKIDKLSLAAQSFGASLSAISNSAQHYGQAAFGKMAHDSMLQSVKEALVAFANDDVKTALVKANDARAVTLDARHAMDMSVRIGVNKLWHDMGKLQLLKAGNMQASELAAAAQAYNDWDEKGFNPATNYPDRQYAAIFKVDKLRREAFDRMCEAVYNDDPQQAQKELALLKRENKAINGLIKSLTKAKPALDIANEHSDGCREFDDRLAKYAHQKMREVAGHGR